MTIRSLMQAIVSWLIANNCLPRALHKIRWIETQARLPEILRSLEVNIVIDVGANIGQFAKGLRLLGYKGRIVSFEPNIDCFAQIKRRFADDRDWLGYPIALGNVETMMPIHFTVASTLSSLLAPNKFCDLLYAEGAAVKSIEQVAVRRLDSLFDELTAGIERPVVFLKMDTQGFDREVFEGTRLALPYIVGLQSEISIKPIYDRMTTGLSVINEYQKAGFDLLDCVPVNRYDKLGFVLEYDCLMARATPARPLNPE